MGTKDPRVDAYIAKSAEFAKPILTHLRTLIHDNCPAVEETMKWSFPHFIYKSPAERTSKVLCSMASFKQHCAFGFWYAEMSNPTAVAQPGPAMGQFGRITSLEDLPKDKVLIKQIKEAVKHHDSGVTARVRAQGRPKPVEKKELEVPAYLVSALKKNKKALKNFEGFNYSSKKEYVDWLTEAKTEATRKTRLDTSVEWISEGKTRHWKYKK